MENNNSERPAESDPNKTIYAADQNCERGFPPLPRFFLDHEIIYFHLLILHITEISETLLHESNQTFLVLAFSFPVIGGGPIFIKSRIFV